MDKQKISVLGLGYIGLPTAALLSSKKFFVNGFDIDESIVNTINDGKIHIVEKDLENYVCEGVKNGFLKANLELKKADIFIIAVPTPFKDSFSPNINYVLNALESISKVVEPGNLIILESTVPVGTTDLLKNHLDKLGINTSELYIAHCPERVLPGNIMNELVSNDRLVGGINKESTKKAVEFYKNFVTGNILETNAKTAEMAKLTENSFRDVNIAFANEISMICDKNNINVWELIKLANQHPRVEILQPGPGVGGHCIAVDPWFVVDKNPDLAKVIKSARERNISKEKWAYEKIISSLENKNNKVTIYGLSFKPNVDDIRESPALNIANKINSNKNFDVCVVEPLLSINEIKKMGFCAFDVDNAVKRTGLHVILVNHDIFREKLISSLQDKNFIDFVGIFEDV